MACVHTSNKASLNKLRTAMYNFDEKNTRNALSYLFTPDAIVNMPWPFGDMRGPDQLYNN